MIHIFKGDCRKRLEELPPNSVDLVLIDPPYILNTHGGTANKNLKRALHDNHIEFISHGFDISVLDLCFPLLRSINILVFCSNTQIPILMSYFTQKGLSTTVLCWHKSNPVPFANGKHLEDLEFIIYARGKGAHFNNELCVKRKSKVYNYPTTNRGKSHPTEKPLELIKELIEVHSFEQDCVLDFYMGSGTTGVACKLLNRDFYGIEIDSAYYQIAKERISKTKRGSS